MASFKTKPIIKKTVPILQAASIKDESKQYPIFVFLLGLLISVLPLIISSDLNDPVLTNRFLFLVSYLALFLLSFLIFKPKFDFKIPKPVIYTFAIAFIFIISNAISTYFAINPLEGLLEISKQLIYQLTILSVLITIVLNKKSIVLFSNIFVIVLIFHAILGIFQYFDIGGREISTGLVSYPFGLNANRNFYGSFLSICIPFALYSFYYNKNLWQYVAGFSLILGLSAILISQTRSAWLASFMIVFFATLLITLTLKTERLYWLKKIGVLILICSAFSAFLIFADETGYLKTTIESKIFGTIQGVQTAQTETLTLGTAESNVAERIELWNKTKKVIADYPLMGVGRNNWKLILGKYGFEDIKAYSAAKFIPDYPHNVYLYIIAESGIIGFLLFIGFIICIIYLGIKTIKRNDEYKALTIFMLAGLLGFGIDSLFSFPDTRIEHMMCFCIIIGAILGTYTLSSKNTFSISNSFKKILYPLSAIIIIFNFYIGISMVRYDYYFSRTDADEKAGRYKNLLLEAQRAKSPLISMGGHVMPIENLEIIAHKNLKNYDLAEIAYQKAKAQSPYLAQIYNNIGTVYIDGGKPEKADFVLKNALKITPFYTVPKQNLSVLYYNKKSYDTCINYLKDVDMDNPPMFSEILKFITYNYYTEKKYEKCREAIKIHDKFKTQKNWFDSLSVALKNVK